MTIYLDALFFLNFYFDFLLLLTLSVTLKRNARITRITLSSLIGSLSILVLFFPLNNFWLFIFKIVLAIIMNIVAFGLKDKKYTIENISYFYMISTILGGFLYYLNLSMNEQFNGFVFVYEDFSYNYAFLLILSPLILLLYIKQRKTFREYQNIIPLEIKFKSGEIIKINGFLDTGNRLIDPVSKKKIILINKKKIEHIKDKKYLYVPYNSLNHHGLIECLRIEYIIIKDVKCKNYLIGISTDNLLKNGIDCVLNAYCLEEIKC